MKYLIIPVKYENLKRGAFTAAERFKNEHDNIDIIESSSIKNIEDLNHLNSKYDRLIFNTQNHTNYTFPLNIISLRNINYLLYSRRHYNQYQNNTCSNGFYTSFRANTIHYIPLITDFKINKKINKDIPCIGFYIRNYTNPDASIYIRGLINSIKQDVTIYTMGQYTTLIHDNKHIKSHIHTYDNYEFFENVTHYVYPMSAVFEDPLPHSIIEAVQSDCQIICPELKGRKYKDGINDILEVTKYHKELNFDIEYDNSDTIFKSKIFKNFYKKVFDNNFEHVLNREKYKTFSSWLEGEVL